VALLLEELARATARLGKPDLADVTLPFSFDVVTSDPRRAFHLEVAETVTMTLAGRSGAGTAPTALHLPAEAFLRLVYGHLDPPHSPAVDPQERSTLDALRKVFPRF
jgi:hypothetical protein